MPFLALVLLGLPVVLSTLSGGEVSAQTFPATVEVDLVFPRNETYAPTPLLPIVFAIQNPQAIPLIINIDWTIGRPGILPSLYIGDGVDLSSYNYSINPYFVVFNARLPSPNNTESAVFTILWDVTVGNCTDSPIWPVPAKYYNNVWFTTKNGAPPTNVETSPGSCPANPVTFNVTGTKQVFWDPAGYGYSNITCPLLAEVQQPANPCAVTVDSAIASSISSSITKSACDTRHPVFTTGCPTPTSKTSLAAQPIVDSRR